MNVDLRYMHCPIFGVCANLSVHCNGYSLAALLIPAKLAATVCPAAQKKGARAPFTRPCLRFSPSKFDKPLHFFFVQLLSG